MKIIFHERYYDSTYAMDPAAASGRLEGIVEILSKNEDFEFISPQPATKEDILRAHSKRHYDNIKRDYTLFELASLAAGGAILAAKKAFEGEPTFAVIRPPGHHASSDSCWGFCYFNNISISLLKLFSERKIKSGFVLDFDLHTGDGNLNILSHRSDEFRVDILNPDSSTNEDYISRVERYMENLHDIDILVASAGFDQGKDDWGGLLEPEDYNTLGAMMKKYATKLCDGKRYALLEGGYNHDVLPINVNSFCQGFK
ncbi:MAG: histone deacetylase family protein [Candidatus Lokiarchaeota archaeon]|nr:histone deacetylase family protein [Candidatus Lokiarchaeota archaeon]